MQSVVVTGGAGFIGSCMVRRLLSVPDLQVISLDKLTYAGHAISLPNLEHADRHTLIEGDICDRELVASILHQYQPCSILHLAAESHVDRSIDAPAAFIQTNVIGTTTLLDATHQYWLSLSADLSQQFRFVHVSTDEVYGSLGSSGKFNENSVYRPNSPYSASKAAADHFVRAYFQTYQLPTIITHCTNNYGPRQLPEKLIPLMIGQAVAGKPLPVYGDGQQVRDWIHVEDHTEALWQGLQKGTPGETYDIGSNCEKTNLELIQEICQIINRLRPNLPHVPVEQLITQVEDRLGHDRRYAVDSSKIMNQLNWRPAIDFQTGLEATAAWYLENQAWMDAVSSSE